MALVDKDKKLLNKKDILIYLIFLVIVLAVFAIFKYIKQRMLRFINRDTKKIKK